MNLIVNISGNYTGGCFQIATSFLYECINFSNNLYYVLLGEKLANELKGKDFPTNFIFYRIPDMPWYKLNTYVSGIVNNLQVDVAFSLFGPPYVHFKRTIHLVGFAQGYYIYPDSPFWSRISWHERLIQYLKKKIHLFYYAKYANAIVSETDDVTNRIKAILGDKKKYYTVSNTCNSYFYNYVKSEVRILPPKKKDEIRLLTVCTYRKHKNIECIPGVIKELKSRGIENIRFVLTIDEYNYHKIFGFNKEFNQYVYNVGYIKGEDLPQLYAECDMLFLPTLIECFSSNYPEAMIMQKCILTSDLDFAHAICKNSALYFNPCDIVDIADKIEQIINDKELENLLRINGLEVFYSNMLTAQERTRAYLNICLELSNSVSKRPQMTSCTKSYKFRPSLL